METERKPVDVLADAQAEMDECTRRAENLRRELQSPRCADREGKRAKIRRIEATRAEIGRAALARIGGA